MQDSQQILEKLDKIENSILRIVPRWLTVREAANYCRISESKMRKLLSSGEMPINRLDGKILLNRRALDYYIIFGTSKPTKRQREAMEYMI